MKNIEFKIINNEEYSDEISDILNEEEMEASIQIKYIKYPNLFASLKIDGAEDPIIVVAIDKIKNKVVAVGACTIFENEIAYLNSFRIKKEYRNKLNFSIAYKKIIDEIEKREIETIITTILKENINAEKLLTKKRKSMPVYEFYKNINFYSIKNKKKGNITVESEEILRYKGNELHLKKKKNKIYIVQDYKKIYAFLYKIRKIISFFGYPELTEKNSTLNFLYFNLINEDNDYSTSLEAIKFLQNMGYNCDFFMIGVFEGSLLDSYLKKIKSFKYCSKIYKVYYNKENQNNEKIRFNFWDL